MDEEISIIDTKSRNEKIKSFFIENKKILISIIITFILLILIFYSYQIYKDGQREQLSEKFNSAVIDYGKGEREKSTLLLKEVINKKDSTYSPLALYFLIDNNLIENRKEINKFFDLLISKTSLEKEIKYLVVYKKALYNADLVDENELLNIVKPLLNSESVWKSHTLYLVAEFFYSKNEKKKSKEFFDQILTIKNPNQDILKETQKRLKRDFSE
tara:strand:+ start:423 stop:1067 length:645 start_codon:yes stop_codon:yes gene_type:complete